MATRRRSRGRFFPHVPVSSSIAAALVAASATGIDIGGASALRPESLGCRRGFLAAAALGPCCAALVPPTEAKAADGYDSISAEKPLLIDELTSRTVRWDLPGGEGPPPSPLGSIRYGTSTLLSSEGSSIPSESPLRLPPWLEGTWAATYRFDRVTFPQGKGRDVLTLRVPGAGLGTCLALPNVGYSPRNPFPLRFLASGGGATDAYSYDDIAYNAPRILEAFWTAAKVASVRTDGGHSRRLSPPCSVTGEGCSSEKSPYLHLPANRIVLEYDGPTRSGGRRAQTMDVTAMRSRTTTRGEGGVGGGEDSDAVVTCRQYLQYNVQQDLQTYYKEIRSWSRPRPSSNSGLQVEGRVRVAAFLPYNQNREEGGIQGRGGAPVYDEREAVAIYDYTLLLTSISEEDAAAM